MVALYLRQNKCRTNYGSLLTLLCICQSICLVFEFANIAFAVNAYFFDHPIYRSTCFLVIFPYVFFNVFQADVVAAISVDFFLCVFFPLQYSHFNRKLYIPLLLFFPFAHGVYVVLCGFIYMDDLQIRFCNPPSALNLRVNSINYTILLAVASVTLLAYTASFTSLYFKAQARRSVKIERKAMKSVKVLVFVYLLNRFTVILFANLINILGVSDEGKSVIYDVILVFALICYSQNFYISYYRSPEYRKMLNAQLGLYRASGSAVFDLKLKTVG
ncbi:unnamed protein product [Caenorhabditis sp. 36 PRJEB53466]|nr:unnamed protein product [Caenorhabditis sp. 36 PRJEB53466]